MAIDYSPAVRAGIFSGRRMVVLTAFLSMAAATLVYTRQGSLPESPPEPVGMTPAAPAPVPTPNAASPATAEAAKPYEDIIQNAVNSALATPEPSAWMQVVVKPGETLSSIFDDQGLAGGDWVQVLAAGADARRLRALRPGDRLNLRIVDGQLEELTLQVDALHTLSVRRGDEGFEASTLTASLDHRQARSAGVIRSSLFNDGRKAGLPNRLILEFADIFGYDIDFAQDLQEGDRFAVIYDQIFKGGRKLRDGDILAAEFVSQGHAYRAVRYIDANGRVGYYTPDGQSLRKAFIRTPVDFVRISSGFSLHRRHPILNTIRAHKGVDYAAPIGTPVHATGAGEVEFIGRKGGYGNVVMLRHGKKYETVYAHLSRFHKGLKLGSRVRQGQVIAYVGMTGLATGPHLHYEFRVNGVHKNPVTVPLPRALPVPVRAMLAFRSETQPMVAELDGLTHSRVAEASR